MPTSITFPDSDHGGTVLHKNEICKARKAGTWVQARAAFSTLSREHLPSERGHCCLCIFSRKVHWWYENRAISAAKSRSSENDARSHSIISLSNFKRGPMRGLPHIRHTLRRLQSLADLNMRDFNKAMVGIPTYRVDGVDGPQEMERN